MNKPLRITFYIVIAFIILIGCALTLGYIYYFIAPFRGAAFDSDIWRFANHERCDRAKMVQDVQDTILHAGTHESTVELALGAPDCRVENSATVEYTIGECLPWRPGLKAMLRVYYTPQKTMIKNHIMWYTVPTRINYSFEHVTRPDAQKILEEDLKLQGAWVVDDLGVRYAINKNNQLVVLAPNGAATFLANYHKGIAGIQMPAEKCAPENTAAP